MRRKVRVIVLSDYGFVNGGAAQVAIASVNGLAASGVDVTFVSSVGPVDPSIIHDAVHVVNFGFHDLLDNPSRIHAAITGIWNSLSAARFEEVLKDFEQENTIIHLHTWVKSLSSSVVHVALKLGFEVVCTLHDYFSICPNGGLYNYNKKQLCGLNPMSLSCLASNCDSRNYGQKLWRVARQAAQSCWGDMPGGIKFFITVSDYSASLLRPGLPLAAQLFRVKNPIEISKVTPSDVKCNDAFTFIGRLAPEKGCVLFAIAARMAGVKAVFVGSGHEEKNIREVNSSAEIVGWKNRAGVIDAIQSSRAIVFPSLLHETQGLIVLEAAALGVAAIVSDACAAKEAIVDGNSGLLFRAGNHDDLAEKLKRLNKDATLSVTLGLSAYERYWDSPCTLEYHVKELVSCYRAIMKAT